MTVYNVNTPLSGIDFTKAYTLSTSTPEYPGRGFTPGTHVQGSDGSTWVFVVLEAATTCTANDFLIVTTNSTWEVKPITSTLAKGKLGQRLGVAGATGTAGQYLWMQTSGYNASANVATSAAAFTALHSTATAGRVSTTAVGGTSAAVSGGVINATAAANVGVLIATGLSVGADD
jgi:hypothetical protein